MLNAKRKEKGKGNDSATKEESAKYCTAPEEAHTSETALHSYHALYITGDTPNKGSEPASPSESWRISF